VPPVPPIPAVPAAPAVPPVPAEPPVPPVPVWQSTVQVSPWNRQPLLPHALHSAWYALGTHFFTPLWNWWHTEPVSHSGSEVHTLPHEGGGTHLVSSQSPTTWHQDIIPPQLEHEEGKHLRPPPLRSRHFVPGQHSVSVVHAVRQHEGLAHLAVHSVKLTSQPTCPHAWHSSGMHLPLVPHTVPLQHEVPVPHAWPQHAGGRHFMLVHEFGSFDP
jgi:hypothetical protein